jgi:hypothetical protein
MTAMARRATKLMMMAMTMTMATGGDGDGATGDTSMATTRWRRRNGRRS